MFHHDSYAIPLICNSVHKFMSLQKRIYINVITAKTNVLSLKIDTMNGNF